MNREWGGELIGRAAGEMWVSPDVAPIPECLHSDAMLHAPRPLIQPAMPGLERLRPSAIETENDRWGGRTLTLMKIIDIGEIPTKQSLDAALFESTIES
jgi:hypothetical protein